MRPCRARRSLCIRPARDVLGELVEMSEVGHPWTHDQAIRQAAVGPRRRAVRAQRVDAEAVRPAAGAAAEYRAVVALLVAGSIPAASTQINPPLSSSPSTRERSGHVCGLCGSAPCAQVLVPQARCGILQAHLA